MGRSGAPFESFTWGSRRPRITSTSVSWCLPCYAINVSNKFHNRGSPSLLDALDRLCRPARALHFLRRDVRLRPDMGGDDGTPKQQCQEVWVEPEEMERQKLLKVLYTSPVEMSVHSTGS